MKKIIMFVLFFSLILVNVVQAVTINVPGRNIEINESVGGGSVNIQGMDGANMLNVNKSTDGSSTITTPKSTINVAPGSANIDVNGSTININKSLGGLNLKVNGQQIKVKSDNDLKIYKQMILDGCTALQGIDTESDTVEVKYNQPARFFGIFKTSLDAKVSVDETGKVEVKLPWYRFLFSKNTGEIKTQIQAKVNDNSSIAVGLERKALMVNLVNENLSLNVAPCKVLNTNTNTNTNTNINTNQNEPVSTAIVLFKGEWNGAFTASSFSDKGCASSGAVSFSINENGEVLGYANVEGVKAPGTGRVDANGNLKGQWTFSGVPLDFSGKLNTTNGKGAGTYQNKLGCFGDFSVNR